MCSMSRREAGRTPVLTRLPARSASTTTLANGSTIASPLNGYQYVKVVTVLPEDDIDFEPWTNCAAWTNRTTELYASPAYTERAAQDKDLLDLISSSGLVGERTVSMANFYNVWDYVRRLSPVARAAPSARAALHLRALTLPPLPLSLARAAQMNVNSIHNASFVAKLNETGGESTLARARDLAKCVPLPPSSSSPRRP